METPTPTGQEQKVNKLSFWIFLISFFLLPIFFIPSESVTFQFAKAFLIFATVIIGTTLWIINKLKEGQMTFPSHRIFLFFAFIPLLFGISTIFSRSRVTSFIGNGYEVGTFAFVVVMFLIAFLVSDLFKSTKASVYAYFAFVGSFIVVVIFHILRLFVGPNFLAFGQFTSNVSSVIGGWNDAGIYFGAVALFSFITLELLKVERWIKWLFIGMLALSLFLLSVVSFTTVWYVLVLFSLIFFIYNFSFNRAKTKTPSTQRKLPVTSLIVLILSIIFILAKGNIYDTLSNQPFNIQVLNRFNISNIEIRPSVKSTFQIGWESMKDRIVLGTGPNMFASQWLTSKPAEINNTIFWNTDFNYGFGLIPTYLTTTGPITFLAWILFFVLFLILGFKALFSKRTDPLRDYLTSSSFIIALYLWIFSFVYIPSAVLIFVTFFFTGLFLASLRATGQIKESKFEFANDPRVSFVSVLVFVVLLLGALISGYEISKRFIAMYYYNQALIAANVNNNIDNAESNLIRAVQFSENDTYYRTLSQLYLVRINLLLANNQVSKDTLQSQFRTLLANAQSAAQAARDYNQKNYQNWISLGNVLGAVVPLNVEGSYEAAKADYLQAQKLNPKNPSILLNLARLEVDHSNVTEAKVYIGQALDLKGDYTDAIFYLAQIQVSEGKVAEAIKSLEASTLISPNDSGLYFQLGLLRYNNNDFAGAASAFEQAVTLLPDYANAKYFLGLTYSKLNRDAEALKLFEQIAVSNPESEEVKQIIANLNAGRDALAGFQSPQSEPEKSTTPPLKDKTATKEEDATDGR